jgi:hypothetical protein
LNARLHLLWVVRALVVCLATGAGFVPDARAADAESPPAAAAGMGAGVSQEPAQPVPWSSLSPGQQRLMGKLSGKWDSLPPERQQSLSRGAGKWLSMSPQERQGAQTRFAQWRSLSPQQQSLIRERWQQFRSLPPEQQRAVRESFRSVRALPAERREALREQWRAASPQERAQMMQRLRERQVAHPQGMPPGAQQSPARPRAQERRVQRAMQRPAHPHAPSAPHRER